MKRIFITGTDTGVGKTIVTGLLAKYLSEKGYKVITQKWIETGCRNFSSDVKLHLKIMGKNKRDIEDYLNLVSPYTFRFASSPHLAAKFENRKIKANKIMKSFKLLCDEFDFVIAEGIGGLLVPFNQRSLVIDIVKRLNLVVLIVAQNRLGAINHTLLTVEALRRRKIDILGIVFSNLPGEKKKIIEDNPKIIKIFTKERIFGVLPWRKNYSNLYKEFLPIGDRIWKRLVTG